MPAFHSKTAQTAWGRWDRSLSDGLSVSGGRDLQTSNSEKLSNSEKSPSSEKLLGSENSSLTLEY